MAALTLALWFAGRPGGPWLPQTFPIMDNKIPTNVGLYLGIIPPHAFTMLVIIAVGLTIMTGPLLQLLLAGAGSRVTSLVEA